MLGPGQWKYTLPGLLILFLPTEYNLHLKISESC